MEKVVFGEIMVETLSKLKKNVNLKIDDAFIDTSSREKLQNSKVKEKM